ncbi:DDE-type integrase/transposase/recombinase [Arthrobacter sp. ISL-72]|nr:DDE-type integrase/transposase/recombinase [Arthrobacter sp. ISL-72]
MREALTTLEGGQNRPVHSDQGFQYQHASWRLLLKGGGAVQSMSRKGNRNDSAVMENFFGHLKGGALPPRPVPPHRRLGCAADGRHPLVQH